MEAWNRRPFVERCLLHIQIMTCGKGDQEKNHSKHRMEQMEMKMVGYLYKTHKMSILSVRLEKRYKQVNKQLNYNKPKLTHN